MAEPVRLACLWRPQLRDPDDDMVLEAVAEKLSALRTESYFRERAARGDVAEAPRVLDRAGVGRTPRKGDEMAER